MNWCRLPLCMSREDVKTRQGRLIDQLGFSNPHGVCAFHCLSLVVVMTEKQKNKQKISG